MCKDSVAMTVGVELGPALVAALSARQLEQGEAAVRRPEVKVEVGMAASKRRSCLKRSRDEGASDSEDSHDGALDCAATASREPSPAPSVSSVGSDLSRKRRRVNISVESEFCYFYASESSSMVSSAQSSPSSSRISSPEPASPPRAEHLLAQAFAAEFPAAQDLDFMHGVEQTKLIDGPALESFIVDKLITLWAKGPNPKAIVPVLSFLVTSGSIELLASVHGRLVDMAQRVLESGKVTLLPSAVILGPSSVGSLSFLAESVRRASLLFSTTTLDAMLNNKVGANNVFAPVAVTPVAG
mmetsp:Transcript_19565/g.30635  ORF Transcript_19565/g.30635 Transcript_19565/m.30635 type:complete len:299 (-) Transcript_19565:20-916(-)